ncbi:S24 family peptidase [Paenibacillus larvae]
MRSGIVKPPSDEITEAIAKVTGCDPLELIWAATIEKSHPKIQKSLMNINASLMKKGIELEKKYPIPDQMDEIDTDKYISSIPEYKKFYDDLIDELGKNGGLEELTKGNEISDLQNNDVFNSTRKRIKIPIYGSVLTSPNGLVFKNYLGERWEDLEFTDDNYFYILIKEDSMIGDGIMPDDLALIKEEHNEDYFGLSAVIVDNEECTIRRIYKKDDSIVLYPSNPTFPPRIFKGQELNRIQIIGKVQQIIRNCIN